MVMTKDQVLHICKDIVQAEKALNDSIDKLLNAVGITREDIHNGYIFQKTDTE